MLGPEICRELYFSFHLGSFGEKEDRLLNTSMLIDGPLLDMEQEVSKWLSNCLGLHTRVVGFGYCQQRFEVRKNGDVQLRIAAGENIFAQHEFHNRYAPVSLRSTGVPSTAESVSEGPANAKAGQRGPIALEVEGTA